MRRFTGKTVLSTGGASGVGVATARRFVLEGANVIVKDRSVENTAADDASKRVAGEMVDARSGVILFTSSTAGLIAEDRAGAEGSRSCGSHLASRLA